MKTLTTQQIEELKKLNWEKVDDFFKAPIGSDFLTELTGYNIYEDTVTIMSPMSWQVDYYKSAIYQDFSEKYYLQYRIFVGGVQWASGNFAMFDGDLLGLYTPKEEPTEEKPETDWRNLLSNVLENALKETDVDSIVEFIDSNFPTVSDKIRENFSDNLEVDDIGEVLKDDIAKDWIEQNADDAYDRAVDNMDSYEMRDKIIDYLQNNL